MISKLDHMYVCVQNLDRAIEFYENILGLKVTNRYKDRWADFEDGEDVYLGLYNPSFDEGTYKIGNNVVIGLKTNDIDAEHERIKKLSPNRISEIRFVNFITPYKYFEVEDTEGNIIEVAQY